MTRLEENGWPKTRGLLKKSKIVTEEAFVNATQDAIRIGLAVGASMPNIAKSIAITCVDEPQTRKAVDEWIDKGATMGDEKMVALSDIFPKWLRFCSITAASKNGDVYHLPWAGSADEYVVRDDDFIEIQIESLSLATIAMCWAYKYPNKAKRVFDNPTAVEKFAIESPHFTSEELQDMVGSQAIYSSWLKMAEELVSRWSNEFGFLNYEDLP